MIRSRMVELRRERDQALSDQKERSVIGPRPYRGAADDTEHQSDRLLPRAPVRASVR
jgi:hypothetical protein